MSRMNDVFDEVAVNPAGVVRTFHDRPLMGEDPCVVDRGTYKALTVTGEYDSVDLHVLASIGAISGGTILTPNLTPFYDKAANRSLGFCHIPEANLYLGIYHGYDKQGVDTLSSTDGLFLAAALDTNLRQWQKFGEIIGADRERMGVVHTISDADITWDPKSKILLGAFAVDAYRTGGGRAERIYLMACYPFVNPLKWVYQGAVIEPPGSIGQDGAIWRAGQPCIVLDDRDPTDRLLHIFVTMEGKVPRPGRPGYRENIEKQKEDMIPRVQGIYHYTSEIDRNPYGFRYNPNNPILEPGFQFTETADSVRSPSVLLDDDQWTIYYAASGLLTGTDPGQHETGGRPHIRIAL